MTDIHVIQITKPEIIEKGNVTIYDYDKSHIIYKMKDLGSFAELQEMKDVNQKYKKAVERAIKLIEDDYYSLSTIDINSITLTSNKLLQVRNILKEVE